MTFIAIQPAVTFVGLHRLQRGRKDGGAWRIIDHVADPESRTQDMGLPSRLHTLSHRVGLQNNTWPRTDEVNFAGHTCPFVLLWGHVL